MVVASKARSLESTFLLIVPGGAWSRMRSERITLLSQVRANIESFGVGIDASVRTVLVPLNWRRSKEVRRERVLRHPGLIGSFKFNDLESRGINAARWDYVARERSMCSGVIDNLRITGKISIQLGSDRDGRIDWTC